MRPMISKLSCAQTRPVSLSRSGQREPMISMTIWTPTPPLSRRLKESSPPIST